MLRTTTLVPMAHLICVAHTRLELAEILVEYRKAGIENLMALGGDPPIDPAAAEGELSHAVELVELARAIGGFSIGVAAQPAGHPDSPDLATDRDRLAAKLGVADFAVTQFFFEAGEYTALVEDLAGHGVDKPVLPGIMPVTSLQLGAEDGGHGRGGAAWMVARSRRPTARGGAEAVRREGVAVATELCEQLLAAGVPGLHFYTLNRSSATREIYSALGLGSREAGAGARLSLDVEDGDHVPGTTRGQGGRIRGRRRTGVAGISGNANRCEPTSPAEVHPTVVVPWTATEHIVTAQMTRKRFVPFAPGGAFATLATTGRTAGAMTEGEPTRKCCEVPPFGKSPGPRPEVAAPGTPIRTSVKVHSGARKSSPSLHAFGVSLTSGH